MRILQGRNTSWCINEDKIASIPPHGVEKGESGQPPRLTAEALEALREADFFAPRVHEAYSLTVLTSTGCNFGCGYCFQNVHLVSEDNHAPDRIPLIRLNEKTIDGIVEFAGAMMQKEGFDKLKLLLFGGEPLLNPGACLAMLRKAEGIGLSEASMITNGSLLTPQLAADLEALKMRVVQITFDGDRESHDRIRTTRSGRGTFDDILRKVSAAAESTDLRWRFRINVSHRNSQGVPGLLEELAAHSDTSRATVNIALVNDVGIGYSNRLQLGDEFFEEYMGWWLRALDLGFSVRTPQEFFCDYCSVQAGGLGAVVNADGTLYSCWETAGKPGLDVGNVRQGFMPAEQLAPRWHACGYDSAPHGEPERTKLFHDKVDAALLDELSERDLL